MPIDWAVWLIARWNEYGKEVIGFIFILLSRIIKRTRSEIICHILLLKTSSLFFLTMQVLARDRLLGSYKVLNPGIFILESNYCYNSWTSHGAKLDYLQWNTKFTHTHTQSVIQGHICKYGRQHSGVNYSYMILFYFYGIRSSYEKLMPLG